MDDEQIFKIICQILDKLHCSEANKFTLRELYFKGKEINLETKINFNFQDSTNFFKKISKHFSFGKHVFDEFQGKNEVLILKEIVDKISQLTTDPIFISCCPNWPKKYGKINDDKKTSIELEFEELLGFAF